MYERNPPPQLRNTNTLFNFPVIPEEILFDEILARLPVKSLSRFKCVSKPWRTLIESDRFIKIHYRYSAKNPIVLLSNLFSKGRLRCSLQWLLKESKHGTDPTKNEPKEGFLLGFCNGVVCCYDRRRFWLRNPATRVSVELPRHNDGGGLSGPLKYGFGWDESTGAYKVFALLFDYKNFNQKRAIVYSSNTNSWRTIFLLPGIGVSLGGFERGLFLRRNLHWIDERHYQIECFDLGREEFGRIELPFVSSINAWLWLGDIGGSLGVLIYLKKRLEVWVMKEYGVKDSWIKLLTFPPTSLPKHMNHVYCPLFGEAPNGETFLIYGETLIIYNPKDDAFSTDTNKVRFIISTDTNKVRFNEALVYVESLVSPETILGAASTNSRRSCRESGV